MTTPDLSLSRISKKTRRKSRSAGSGIGGISHDTIIGNGSIDLGTSYPDNVYFTSTSNTSNSYNLTDAISNGE